MVGLRCVFVVWCALLMNGQGFGNGEACIWVPHVPQHPEFRATLMIDNQLSIDRALVMEGYDGEGTWLGRHSLISVAASRLLVQPDEYFAGQAVAYLTIVADTWTGPETEPASLAGIAVAVEYSRALLDAPRSVLSIDQRPARIWRIQAGDWRRIVDGVALVNVEPCLPAGVSVKQFSRDGKLLTSHELIPPGQSFAKRLLDLAAIVPAEAHSYVEIHSRTKLAVAALRVAKQPQDGFAQGNMARPLREYETERYRLLQQRARWRGQGFSSYEVHVTRQCHYVEELTRETYMLVREGIVQNLLYADSLEPLPLIYQREFMTIDALFDLLEKMLLTEPFAVRIRYDEVHFFPSEIRMDPDGCVADEELVIRLDQFAPQRGS